MATLSASMLLPPKLKFDDQPTSISLSRSGRATSKAKNTHSFSPVMRLFGPAIFEASKLKVLILGVDKEKHPGKLPRAYTLTHSDITSQLTLAISQTINNSQLQGWYNKLQRDEVVAEWKKVKGKMSLHVHCHISGGHFLLDLLATFRNYIFCKELPVVLSAFVHGDESLFNNYPDLKEALVWVYFHSNIPEFNKLECWGPLKDAMTHTMSDKNTQKLLNFNGHVDEDEDVEKTQQEPSFRSHELSAPPKWEIQMPDQPCKNACNCCFPSTSLIPWSSSFSLSGPHQGMDKH